MATPKLVVCITTFRHARGVFISRGEILEAADPIVKSNPSAFEPAEKWARRLRTSRAGIEQATAAPGEIRDANLTGE